MRLVFIIDDERHEDLCHELNNVDRLDDDVIVLAKDARSAVVSLIQLAEKGCPIDIMMLDHDLGDGLDTTWFLNWLLDMIDENDPQYLEEPLKWVGHILKDTQWLVHTSNFGRRPAMRDKIDQIKEWLDNHAT